MRLGAVLFSVLLGFAPALQAFELLPMVAFLSEKGSNSEHVFQVVNTSDKPLPVEVQVKYRDVTGDKPEVLLDSDDFFVFPPQVLIPPGQTQSVKAKYIGQSLSETQSYRVVFSQLPIEDESDASAISMLFQVGALVFVGPDQTEQRLLAEIREGNQLYLENQGTGVVIIPQLNFSVRADNGQYQWQWEQIKPLIDRQFLAPKQHVSVAVESLMKGTVTQASVEVKERR
ncbi:fimbria/pilus periplasmic chaperone [Ferrimonas balearica]|uniref:fimbria/pilus periplasmic chaperone n=1 Tax=Ferrimonas balearica TaxID=44012 RepID=UPI001C94E439|nr:fimbria/pilus periplasmic chaperone [Ferrimonas balearica]MBY6224171.1 fimbria/pilus periplasmic chaperone [Ferrimonas balearica]